MSGLTYDDDTTAELAACTSRMEQMEVLIAALGGGPRTWTCKRAAAWVSWAAATTFYEATVTGTMSALVDKLDNFGVVTAIATRLPAALNSGTSFFRITRGSRYVQGSMGLDGSSKDMMIPANLSGDYSMSLNSFKIVANQSLAIAPDRLLYEVSMVNTSGSTQAADFVSPMFGLAFKQGDIPASTYPQIKTTGGIVCPATLHSITSWPDGSMKFCGAFCRVPSSIAGSGTLTLEVRSGAAAPASGARSTSDLTAADIKTELVGVDGFTGTLTTSLNNAISTGNVVLFANGPAGALWRIDGEARDGSNTAHGQIYCWHYVMAMTNAAGTLLGLRYLGRIAQPWMDPGADTTYTAPRHRDLSATLKRGSTTIRAFTGYTDESTLSSTIRLPHNTSFFTAGTDGRWDFVQGGGSAASDCTVRVTTSVSYFKQTKVVPPYNLAAGATDPTAVDYRPFGFGSINYAMGSTGEREDIGVFPEWCVRHMAIQSAITERNIRVNGLTMGHCRYTYRDRASKQPTPCTDIQSSYTGLGTIRTSYRTLLSNQIGLRAASPNTTYWGEDGSHPPAAVIWPYLFSGEPQYLDMGTDMAFARVLEMHPGTTTAKVGAPITDTMQLGYGGRLFQVGSGGTVYKGAVFLTEEGGLRTPAWCMRDVAFAAAFLPDTPPDGADSRTYLRDVCESNYAGFVAYWSALPAGADGIIAYMGGISNGSPWMSGHYGASACYQSDILPGANVNAMRAILARFWEHTATAGYNVAAFMQYRWNPWNGNRFAESIEDCTGHCAGPSISFSAATGRGTIQTLAFNSPNLSFTDAFLWTLTNGDAFAVGKQEYANTVPWTGVAQGQVVYAVNVVGNTFQAALAPGGAPLTVPINATISNFFARPKNMAPSTLYNAYALAYQGLIAGTIQYFKACGESVDTVLAQSDAIVAAQLDTSDFVNNAKYRFATTRS